MTVAIPAMPGGVSELLGECFRQDPAGAADELGRGCGQVEGDLPRVGWGGLQPHFECNRTNGLTANWNHTASHRSNGAWTDPQEWLQKALQATGRDPAEAAAMVARRGVTRQGELVAELAVYDEAKQLYARLVRDGRKELESDLATLCLNKALVHQTAADAQGGLQEYDQAIAIWERLVNQEGRRELADGLAVYLHE